MTKTPANPFDALTTDTTPHEFWDCALSTLNWLEPYLKNEDIHHQTYVSFCVAYSKMIFGDPDNPDQKEDCQLLVMRQRQIISTFKTIREPIVAAEAIAKVEKQSNAQRERASQQTKVSESGQRRIVKVYLEKEASGSVYGVVKDLARHYEVTSTAIHAILRKHGVEPATKRGKNSIDK